MHSNSSYYAVIPANIRYDKTLSPNAKLLYGEITTLFDNKGKCYPSNKYFAELYNVSIVSVAKWIGQLINNGYIISEINKIQKTRCLMLSAMPVFNITKQTENKVVDNRLKELKKEKINVFNEFRKKYKGTKRGLDIEYENFIKKTKDWEEVVDKLMKMLDYQINYRKWVTTRNEWVPQWKNLNTWVNNKCWEERYPKYDEYVIKRKNNKLNISPSLKMI